MVKYKRHQRCPGHQVIFGSSESEQTLEEKEDGEKKVEKETVVEEEVGAANPGLLQTQINPMYKTV